MIRRERQKDLILFVHGFGSSSRCWKRLIELLDEDERITPRYELSTWDYPTKWIELQVFGRIPRLQELGRSLADEIDSPRYHGRSLTLVGHSQGGLVIQSYFAEMLDRDEADRLRHIRQAIFFATPSEGSSTLMPLRRLLSLLVRNPQELTLRVLNPDVADLRARIRERIVGALTDDRKSSWRIPIHAFCGLQDDIVPEPSARGPFDSVKRINGTHFSIITPRDRADSRYAELAEHLLDPGGHTHRFEIESYEATIRVEPRDNHTVLTSKCRKPRLVEFDNAATVKRTVRFAAANRCKKPFTIRYITRNGGYVEAYASHPNEASSIAKGQWEDTGQSYQFDFTPVWGQEYRLDVKVYKGFDQGARDIHLHLGSHSHYRRITYVLDLSAYLANGYDISSGPHFYLDPIDREHGDLCQRRDGARSLESHPQPQPGVYCWELADMEEGIIDIVWDVEKALVTPGPPVHPEARSAESPSSCAFEGIGMLVHGGSR
jgi:pimeloyl-ACP methyl ester carboxylesterase